VGADLAGDPRFSCDTGQVTTEGVVRVWHDDEGWGVLDSPVTPGGCWAHFSHVLVPGYRRLAAGQLVTFGFEAAQQDGYSFRATEAWPAGSEPLRLEPETGPSDAYRSTLTITWHSAERRESP
jgi:CspA family cold shock protein